VVEASYSNKNLVRTLEFGKTVPKNGSACHAISSTLCGELHCANRSRCYFGVGASNLYSVKVAIYTPTIGVNQNNEIVCLDYEWIDSIEVLSTPGGNLL
jgi:hypothetical protein